MEALAGNAGLMTLPNAITLLRLCAVPACVWLIMHLRLDLAFWVFVGAGISDALDGWLARVRHSRSALGAMLDPVADKALLVCSYVALAASNVLPDWLALVVVFRDILIVGGVLLFWVLGAPMHIRPLRISKLNTALQIVLVALAMLLEGHGWSSPGLMRLMVWLVMATTVASGIAYVASAARHSRQSAP